MKPDDIISYNELVAEEKANLQKGMNFGIGEKYPVFLPQSSVSRRDRFGGGFSIHEGHGA
jgi:hypothetical protein